MAAVANAEDEVAVVLLVTRVVGVVEGASFARPDWLLLLLAVKETVVTTATSSIRTSRT